MEDNNTNIETKVEDTKVDEPKAIDIKTEEPKTLTMTQAELDVLITKRLERASKKAGEAKVEAEKLAKMSEADRQQALFEAEKATFAEERKLYQREKLELQVIKELSTKNLPTEFSKYLIGMDAETCISNIKEFDLHWQQAIANALDGKLRGNTPKTGSGKVVGTTKEDFNKMPYKERMALYNDNQELYQELNK